MNDQKNSLPVFVAGVIIGAAAVYLFTNKEGQKIKDRLLKEGAKLLQTIGENLEEAQENIKEEATKEVGELTDTAKDHIEETKDTIGGVVSEIPEHVEKLQKKGRRLFFRRHHSAES